MNIYSKQKPHFPLWASLVLGALFTIAIFSAISTYLSAASAIPYFSSDKKVHRLEEMSENQLRENLWVKAELGIVPDYYLSDSLHYRKTGTITNFNYIAKCEDQDGKVYLMTVYVSEWDRMRFEKQADDSYQYISGKIDSLDTIRYEGSLKKISKEEKETFKTYLISNFDYTEEEAENAILPYGLKKNPKIGESVVHLYYSIGVFLCSLVSMVLFSVVSNKKIRKNSISA
mgnify:CR=1 FL=1